MENFAHTVSQPFYNTILLTEEQWKDRNDKALALQKIIETVYSNNPTTKISGWQMWEFLCAKLGKKLNILSVRRSISNLKNEGKLIRLNELRKGNEGESEHLYIWKEGNEDKKPEKLMDGKSVGEFAADIIDKGKQGDLFE